MPLFQVFAAGITVGGPYLLHCPYHPTSAEIRTMTAFYPASRLRRTRAYGWSRALHRETVLTPSDLIWPLFVTEGEGVEDPVTSLPGVSRWSVDLIVERAKEAIALGIPALALFPNTPADRRSDKAA